MTYCVFNTMVKHYPKLGLFVKREDLCCPGGPNFSKTRGVYEHIKTRPETLIGVLDTSHSQGGWAVARACALLGRKCELFYPVYPKAPDQSIKPQQMAAFGHGAMLRPVSAGRSAVLYHGAKKQIEQQGGYMMPNALKLRETVTETAAELGRTTLPPVKTIIVSASSGTIAAGLVRGLGEREWKGRIVVHLGYSRSEAKVRGYIAEMAWPFNLAQDDVVVDEGYAYKDKAWPGAVPDFPCNEYYDRKLFVWWARIGRAQYGTALMWNVG